MPNGNENDLGLAFGTRFAGAFSITLIAEDLSGLR